MNLITNAAEAIGDAAGVVRIRTGVSASDAAVLGAGAVRRPRAAVRYVALEVTDTGCGMDEATWRASSIPSSRPSSPAAAWAGGGARHRARDTAAPIVDSQPGEGTAIRVLFPPSETPRRAKGSAVDALGENPQDEKSPAVSGTILVVDDEEVVRDVCAQMVEFLGFRVLRAANGEEAVTLFRAHSREIVGVILDLTMPQMDGVAAFEALRRIQPDVNVILSSGYDELEATERFAGRGLACFLQKPYELDTLKARLERVRVL